MHSVSVYFISPAFNSLAKAVVKRVVELVDTS